MHMCPGVPGSEVDSITMLGELDQIDDNFISVMATSLKMTREYSSIQCLSNAKRAESVTQQVLEIEGQQAVLNQPSLHNFWG